MMNFDDWEDVDEWLKPLDYESFWNEVRPFSLDLQSKRSCDEQIASGSIDEATVLDVLKFMARLELTQRYRLQHRDAAPWFSLH